MVSFQISCIDCDWFVWQELCKAHGNSIQQNSRNLLPALKSLQKAITRIHQDLADTCSSNEYMLRYLCSASAKKWRCVVTCGHYSKCFWNIIRIWLLNCNVDGLSFNGSLAKTILLDVKSCCSSREAGRYPWSISSLSCLVCLLQTIHVSNFASLQKYLWHQFMPSLWVV